MYLKGVTRMRFLGGVWSDLVSAFSAGSDMLGAFFGGFQSWN
jgi:hypothetical protein